MSDDDQNAAIPPPDDDGVCGTDVTMEFLEETLRRIFGAEAKFGANAKTEEIGHLNGFLSFIVRLLPDWQVAVVNGKKLPETLVVKIPSSTPLKRLGAQRYSKEQMKNVGKDFDMNKQMEMLHKKVLMAHACEASFYEMAIKEGLTEQLSIPHCYYQRQFGENGEPGLIIMEDLSDKAGTRKIYEGIPVESIKALFYNLATVHAYSLKNNAWRSNPNLQLSFAKFQKLTGGDQSTKMLGAMLGLLKSAYADTFDPMIDRLVGIYNAGFDAQKMDELAEKLGLPSVMTHGDLWMNNIMWEKKQLADGKTATTDKLVAIVDWQLVHPGCIGEDFVRLMCSSVDPAVRREHLEELVECYHAALTEKLGREPPFTVSQIIDAYKRLFLYGVMMILPMYGGYLTKETGMLGTEDVEARQKMMLNRAKCMIEDVYAYEDELKGQ